MVKKILPKKYNKKLLLKLLVAIVAVMVIGFLVAVILFGYNLTSWDVPGGLIAAPLLAHLIYLIVSREEDLK